MEELFAAADQFVKPGGGSFDQGGYAGELQGMIKESLDALFDKAEKKKEQVTLISCKDWLGNKAE